MLGQCLPLVYAAQALQRHLQHGVVACCIAFAQRPRYFFRWQQLNVRLRCQRLPHQVFF